MRGRPMLYPNTYVWLVFVSALDVILTWVVLYFGGYEANAIAAAVLERFGLPGMVVFKFALITVAILIAEAVGRRNLTVGRRFALAAVGLTCIPVVVAFVLLLGKVYG